MATANAEQAIPSEDREIYEQLAQLQNTYDQISELRTLLPDKLVNPTRSILRPSSRSAPEKLAAQLKEAAVNGSRDIQQFKKDYYSDQMRELFQKVNAAEIPQGQDNWSTNYVKLLKDLDINKKKADDQTSNEAVLVADGTISDVDAIKKFRKEHPEVEVVEVDESVGSPLLVKASPLTFRVDKERTEDKERHPVTVEDRSLLGREVQQHLHDYHIDASLPVLLGLLASYVNVRDRKCEKCDQIYDSSLQNAFARKRRSQVSSNQSIWEVLHPLCMT